MIGPYELDQIYQGDCRELSRHIPDHSIDLIFTDPPYLKEYLYLYDWLADEAPRVLKPNGFLLTYVGGYWKDKVMTSLGRNMEYFYDYIVWEPEYGPILWQRKTITRCKSIMAYRQVGSIGLPRTTVLGVWLGSEQDKRYHVWGQDESEARYFIDCFSKRGDLVLEPFSGGGTTPAICKLINRSFVAFEIDPSAADVSRSRVDTTSSMYPDLVDERKIQPDMFLSNRALMP
jgi:DNA modification methylase